MKKASPVFFQLLLIIFAFGLHTANAKPVPGIKPGLFKFQSAEYKLAISFPEKFEENVSSKEENNTTMFTLKLTCTIDKDLYMASATKHAVPLNNPLQLADVSLNSFAKTLNGEIISEQLFSHKKKQGKEALIYLPEQKLYAHYRVILVGFIQYQVIVLDNQEALSKTAAAFFKSFQIL